VRRGAQRKESRFRGRHRAPRSQMRWFRRCSIRRCPVHRCPVRRCLACRRPTRLETKQRQPLLPSEGPALIPLCGHACLVPRSSSRKDRRAAVFLPWADLLWCSAGTSRLLGVEGKIFLAPFECIPTCSLQFRGWWLGTAMIAANLVESFVSRSAQGGRRQWQDQSGSMQS